jgi:hypothetical protein
MIIFMTLSLLAPAALPAAPYAITHVVTAVVT